MKTIKDAGVGTRIRWNRFGRWAEGKILDVMPPVKEGGDVGGFIVDLNGKRTVMPLDRLLANDAQPIGGGR